MVIEICNHAFKIISQEVPAVVVPTKKKPPRSKSRSPFKKRKTKELEVEPPIEPVILTEAEKNPLEFIVEQVKSAGVEPPNPEYIPSFKDILEQMQKAQMFYLFTKRPVKLKIKKLK